MKTLALAAMAALLTSPLYAGGLSDPIIEPPAETSFDLSGYNDGLPVRVQCTNVPARSGSVAGVLLTHGGPSGYIVEEAGLPYATTDRIIGVMPAGMSTKDSRDMEAFLTTAGLTNYELVIRPDRDRRIVEEVKERGVATGPVPTSDNLTSMGEAASDGATILRVRSTVPQDVQIQKYGGSVQTVTVGAGDTLVAVPGQGTYIATFTGTHVRKTKATGPQTFDDINEVAKTFTRNGRWCR